MNTGTLLFYKLRENFARVYPKDEKALAIGWDCDL
jgi:hypothetical protein